MEGTKFQKPTQGYRDKRVEHRRCFRNRREDDTHSQTQTKDSNQSVQHEQGKVNCVKPRRSRESIKDSVVTSETHEKSSKSNFMNAGQNKPFSGGKDGAQAKEQKSGNKYIERKKYPVKENSTYSRPFKTVHAGKHQSKSRDSSSLHSKNSTNTTGPEEHKSENEPKLVKHDNTVATTHYLKPAVHVQPILQLPGENNPDCTSRKDQVRHDQSDYNLVPDDSSLQLQQLLHLRSQNSGDAGESKIDRSSDKNETSSKEQPVPTLKETVEKCSSEPVHDIPGGIAGSASRPTPSGDSPQGTSLQNNGTQFRDNPVFQYGPEPHSAVCQEIDSQKNVDQYLPSSFYPSHPSLVPHIQSKTTQQLKTQSATTERSDHSRSGLLSEMIERPSKGPSSVEIKGARFNDPSIRDCHYVERENGLNGDQVPVAQKVLEMSLPQQQSEVKKSLVNGSNKTTVVHVPYCELEHLNSLDERYGYRISVDSLFSSSFFASSQATRKMSNDHGDDTNAMFQKNQKDDCVGKDEMHIVCVQEPAMDMRGNQVAPSLLGAPNFSSVNQLVDERKGTSFLAGNNSFASPSLGTHAPHNEHVHSYDARLVSPRNRSEKLMQTPPSAQNGSKFNMSSPRGDISHKPSPENICVGETFEPSFATEDIKVQSYKPLCDNSVEETFCHSAVHSNLGLVHNENSKIDALCSKDVCLPIEHLNPSEVIKDSEMKHESTKNRSGMHTSSLVTINYDKLANHGNELQADVYPSAGKDNMAPSYAATTVKTSSYDETQGHQTSSERDKQIFKKHSDAAIPGDDEDPQVHRRSFPQGPYLSNPFFSHPLLTHRHTIPSAFVYPSRVGIPGTHSGFNEVAQHSGSSPSSHLFPPHGTVVLNVGGRLFEVLPSTFAAYPESLLYQVFTGATSPPISQRGHIFFDRDGYLFEIILAFARVGHLTLPPRVSLTSLINEAKFFGMYDYMFQQGQVAAGCPFHFQRTTSCTLGSDRSGNKNERKVFVLEGEDKLKIESLKVSGACHLYVDLYTPFGVKETSNFLLYDPEKPDLWKAYQFCAERQLVFHLGQSDKGGCLEQNNASVHIVFAQTFVFHGDEFIP